MIRAAATIAAFFGTPVAAVELRSCDRFEGNAQYVDFAQSPRDFANGQIRFIPLDTFGEPACCSMHLMVLYPEPDEPFPNCKPLSRSGNLGWWGVDLANAKASYDPTVGLRVGVPTSAYVEDQGTPVMLEVIINQAKGKLNAGYGLP